MWRRISVAMVLCGVVFYGVNGDFPQLHRALPSANGKPGYRVTSSYQQGTNNVGDNNSIQNKHGMGTDNAAHGKDRQKTMDFESQWSQAVVYSLISCTLVGLSGIFPLIVIPLEAGPSLKHGGKIMSACVVIIEYGYVLIRGKIV